jgi:hypothetical protein
LCEGLATKKHKLVQPQKGTEDANVLSETFVFFCACLLVERR